MKITVKQLRKLGAECSQLEKFIEIFGDSVEVIPSNFEKALKNGLDVFYPLRLKGYRKAISDDEYRKIACQDACCAYWYACNVDKQPRDDTRIATFQDAMWVYYYAHDIDRQPRDDTRKAACQSACWAYWYARNVDKQPRDDTRKAACRDGFWAYWYTLKFDKKGSIIDEYMGELVE